MKYEIFISYCRIDSTIAKQITHKLKDFGLNCFVDFDALQLGRNYTNTLQSVILESKYVIYIYGENSEDNIWQRRELDLALESGKKVFSLFIKPCNEGVVSSILKKKTICYTSIDKICNSIQREISPAHCCSISIPSETTEKRPYSRKNRKKRYIFLAIITLLFIICLLFPNYYTSSPPLERPNTCPNTSKQSDNITDSIYSSEILDRDTVYISFKGNEPGTTKITSTPQLSDWEGRIWVNRCLSALGGLLLGIILVLIIKFCRKKRNIKLSSDVNVSVSIDGKPIAKIDAGNVFSTHLEKGEYLIDFKANDDKHNRIIQKIIDNNTHVIFSEFINKQEIKFKCFIAGSLELSVERNALIAVVSKMHNRWEAERFRISSYTFEDFNRDVIPGGQQKLYDTFIENDADWCVFIISNGIGEKTLNEYRVAMNSLHKNGHPKILFLASSETKKDETLSAIKKEIIDANQYWNSCNNIEHMQSIFRDCIEWDVTLLSKSKDKR